MLQPNLKKSDAAWKRLQTRTGNGIEAPVTRRAFMEHNPSVVKARRERMLQERAGRTAPVTNEPRTFVKVKGTEQYVEV